jgi:hypothetical protein
MQRPQRLRARPYSELFSRRVARTERRLASPATFGAGSSAGSLDKEWHRFALLSAHGVSSNQALRHVALWGITDKACSIYIKRRKNHEHCP